MAQESSPNLVGRSMTEWSVALHELTAQDVGGAIDQKELARLQALGDEIDQEKISSLQALENLGLPRYRQLIVPMDDFLAEPDSHFNQFDLDTYFTILAPSTTSLPRPRKQFINEEITPENRRNYSVILQEAFPQRYGGNIVCNDDGSVLLEMLEGDFGHNRLIGGELAAFTAKRNPFSGRFSYSFEDEALRQATWAVINCIPRDPSDMHANDYVARTNFHPGYYEFLLVQRTDQAPLEPIFIDYSNKPAFRVTV
jgi:hypothetical protein